MLVLRRARAAAEGRCVEAFQKWEVHCRGLSHQMPGSTSRIWHGRAKDERSGGADLGLRKAMS